MAPNLLTNRLHQQRDRIAGMLMPGAKTVSGQRPLSPLLPGFGTQKFKLAARKMRAIDPARLGSLQPENIVQHLIGPVDEARNLLHLKPVEQDGASTPWSKVETIFPSAAVEPEPPPAPGELRQGSIIPRMALTPKPGQSLESFKEQIAQRPKAPPPPDDLPKPRIAPKSRLFTHIQEIIPPKTPDELPGSPAEEETIQSQPDFKQQIAAELPQKPVKTEKAVPREEPIFLSAPLVESKPAKAEEPPSQSPVPQAESALKAAAPSPKDEIASLPRAVPVPPQKPAPAEQILPRAAPTPKQPQAAASPLPSSTQKPAAQAKPTERESASPAKPKPAPKDQAPQAAAGQPTSAVAPPQSETSQRFALDLPAPVEEPSGLRLAPPPALPDAAKPAPESKAATVSEPGTPLSDEMPLRKQITYRKQSPAKLKMLTPQPVKPKIEMPALVQPEKPLIPPQKYRPSAPAVIARQPGERSLSDLLPLSETQQVVEKPQLGTKPQPQRTEAEGNTQPTSDSSTRPVSMALAYPPRLAEPAKQTPSAPPLPPVAPASPTAAVTAITPQTPAQHSPETPVPLTVRPASVQNVIQRKWPENEGDASSNMMSSGQGADQASAGQAQSGFNLAQLAEDVFPYVKRLIEIESDRISSRFR